MAVNNIDSLNMNSTGVMHNSAHHLNEKEEKFVQEAEVDGIERHRPGYRSIIFTRMRADNLYHYYRENRQYRLTSLGRDLLRFAEENA